MDLQLTKETRSKLYLAALDALDGCDDQDTAEAFADVVSFGNDGKRTATTALRLNGFTSHKNSDAWTNSPNGGRGFVVSIGADFFTDHLKNWAKAA